MFKYRFYPHVMKSKFFLNFLLALIAESNVSSPFRQQINSKLRNGDSLDPDIRIDSTGTKRRIRGKKHIRVKQLRPCLRPKSTIDALEENPPYRPLPVPKNAGEPEKARLAYMMAYGVDPLAKRKLVGPTNDNARFAFLRRKLDGVKKTSNSEGEEDGNDEDRFTEYLLLSVIREVKERREFLSKMAEYGKDQVYRNEIETEISQLVREMELIDLRKTRELENALKMAESKEQRRNESNQQ
ncbi:hypothetical protein FGIG_10888 [Fasciola gigantica]|uniref:Uncharacterized protein n=1 Tax=Fasciola gigantica TaxID=46835 RepID=A0A504YEF0_FASGI|nr:hypothetical protein FGIG_10888 [Fasciola gigantica]